jgi:hypothetical protein
MIRNATKEYTDMCISSLQKTLDADKVQGRTKEVTSLRDISIAWKNLC